MTENIALITYETPYAPAGGISAVMKHLPRNLLKVTGRPTVVVTPFHHMISNTTAIEPHLHPVGSVEVTTGDQNISVQILHFDHDVAWYFLRPQDEKCFAGKRHPYDVDDSNTNLSPNLTRDSFIFGIAASKSLSHIHSGHWTLLLQDWEAATVALALAGQSKKTHITCFLTIHNSYDMPAGDSVLRYFDIDPANCPGETILQRALPLIAEPVFTVSEQFAVDLCEDALQTEVRIPHLARQLRGRLVGIDNGLFSQLTVDNDALLSVREADYEPLERWKSTYREYALIALENHKPTRDQPVWGDIKKFTRDDSPWFVMAGRNDARQKGYDVACQAAVDFISNNGYARFLFFPIPGEEGLDGLNFLRELAFAYPENVMALPFFFQDGYFAALQGATYGIMPSFYEPFGMANEFYMKGTVGIGRATGGIIQQIVPLRSAIAFTKAVNSRIERRYPESARPTGILYRESDDIPDLVSEWKEINKFGGLVRGSMKDLAARVNQSELLKQMVKELRIALEDGVRVYQNQRELYYTMIVEGIEYLESNFSWERAAKKYAQFIK